MIDPPLGKSVSEYWTDHNVTNHRQFTTAQESKDSFLWRCRQYIGYLEYMPVDGAGGKAVLDYGCGPGHDLAGFLMYAKEPPLRLVGADVSPSSLAEARARAALHEGGDKAEFVQIDENEARLPFEDETFDIIHSSGVLHHIKEHKRVLSEFRRILKPGGYAQIMVYNYNSIWMHLYASYDIQIKQGLYPGLGRRELFTRTTDGPDCPIADCYTPEEYIAFVESVGGLKCEFKGAAVSAHEMQLLPQRFAALQDARLNPESREFLYSLTFDERGLPLYNGVAAGVDACYIVTRN